MSGRPVVTLAILAVACSDYNLQVETVAPATDSASADSDVPSAIADEDLPLAMCDVSPNPVHPPFDIAIWDGSKSYDPLGEQIVDFEWTLESQPMGSSVSLAPGGDSQRTLAPDLAGDYVAQLVVTTSDGRESEPCEAVLEAVPAQHLWIEMFWSHAGDDMDLHLLAPGGLLWTPDDCHWMNCVTGNGLNWGDASAIDNPRLDLDDIVGVGPENVNISEPGDGVYTVVVHDYWGSSYKPDNSVTVKVYVDGALEWSDTRAMAGEDGYETFAAVDWTQGTVDGL
jgi:hypothetical protein